MHALLPKKPLVIPLAVFIKYIAVHLFYSALCAAPMNQKLLQYVFLPECLDALEMHIPLSSNFTSFSIYFPHLLSLDFMVLHQEAEGSKDKAGLGAF